MIYLDNAATTWPKPPEVHAAITEALRKYGANPGRSAYEMANETTLKVFECRSKVAEFFNVAEEERVIFTPGCTWSLNTVIKGCLRAGDHVVISDMEHNAVVRPLHGLLSRGISYTRARVVEGDEYATLANFSAAIQRNTKMVVCTDASNVFGIRVPTAEIGAMCHRNGVLMVVDAAQSAGVTELDAAKHNADFICAPAHKGLYGTMGLGLLLVCGKTLPNPLAEGGTGSFSAQRKQPQELPDRLESGTLNVPAICALSAGLDAIARIGRQRLAEHEYSMIQKLYDELEGTKCVELYTQRPCREHHVPLLSFNVSGLSSEETAVQLAQRGIAVRAGLHCANDAHIAKGTQERGTVRVCVSMFTSEKEIAVTAQAVKEIARQR